MGINAAPRVAATLLSVIVLRAHQHAELALDDAIVFVSIVDNFSAHFDILFERLMAAIDHDAGKPFVDAFFAQFKRIAVVQVNGNRNIREADRGFDQLF